MLTRGSRTPRSRQAIVAAGLAGIAVLGGCSRAALPPAAPRSAPPLPALALAADSAAADTLAPGAVHHRFYLREGPWAVQVLDLDRSSCWTVAAVKRGDSAVGRARTSELVALADSVAGLRGGQAVGGVNADFFSFTPPGVPSGVMVHRGRILTPPRGRPAFALDSGGRPWIGVFRGAGSVGGPADPARRGVAPEPQLEPFHPLEAVGGFPVLVRDSVEADTLDRAGATTFAPVRHPRTLVGTAAGGRRLLLVTVDGRQAGYSAGMTLRESARLLLRLGATEGLNLDGGGSTTLVVRGRGASGARFVVANRPSDAAGERPVGNALVAVSGCPR